MSSNDNQNSENNDNSYQATAETNYEILTNSSSHTASITTTFVVAAASPTAVDQLPPPPSAEIQSGVTVAVPSPIPMGIVIGTTSGAATGAEMMSTMSTIVHHATVSGERRERLEEDAAAGGSAQKRVRGQLDAPKKSGPMCAPCSKKFGSWKAVFRHMRAHPDRVWRGGGFPPPVGGWSSSPERAAAVLAAEEERDMLVDQLAPTLLNIATEKVARLEEEENQEELGGDAERKRRRGRGISIDLNELPAGSGPGSGSSSVSSRGNDSIDLNRPPRNSDLDEPETGGGGDDVHHR